MPKISLPSPDEPIGTCPHCGTNVPLKKSWRDKLQEIVRVLNGLS
jgi:hypothetical protein